MGGNVNVNGFQADPLDLTVYSREEYQHDIFCFVRFLNNLFKTEYGETLFENENLIFSGSTAHLMSPYIDTDELVKYKPKFGDIDILFPKEHKAKLLSLLEMRYLFDTFESVGCKNGSTISVLFQHKATHKVHQIDFAPVDFVDGKPSELAVISHMSDWNDVKHGIKGIFHKKAIGALTGAYGRFGLEEKKDGSLEYGFLPDYSFCVDRGLRQRYVLIRIAKDGTEVYRKAAPKEFPYISSLFDIMSNLLGLPPGFNTLVKFTSFLGILSLIDESFDKVRQSRILEKLTNSIYDKLNRPTEDDDEEKRTKVVGFIREKFPWYFTEKRNEELKELADKYYKREK